MQGTDTTDLQDTPQLEMELIPPKVNVEGRKKAISSPKEIVALAAKLNKLEKAFAQQLVYHPGKTDKQCLRDAGSKAQDHNLSKMAYEMKTRPEVKAYIEALGEVRSEDANIDLQEIIGYARECIQMAMANEKPKEAEGHIRLLAELGGHLKSSGGASPVNVEITQQTAASFRGDKFEDDIKRLQAIVKPNG